MSPPRDDEPPSEDPDRPVDGGDRPGGDDGTGPGETDDGSGPAEAGPDPGGVDDAPSDRDATAEEEPDAETDDGRGRAGSGGVPESGENRASETEGGRASETEGGRASETEGGRASETEGGRASKTEESRASETEGNRGDPPGTRASDGTSGVAVNRGEAAADAPAPHRSSAGEETAGGSGLRTFVVDVVSSALAVLLVGALLFAVSGVWPPMVAIESGSMEPHMSTGDLVFVMEEERFPGDGAVDGTGVVTLQSGQDSDYRKFQRAGDVIVYKPDGSASATPIIHRAMFYVEEGENWYDEADRQSIGRYSECGETADEALPTCPAPHAGFITKGDANGAYDQAQADPLSGPVKPGWIVGTAEVRIPKLGCIRLRNERCADGFRAAPTGATAAVPDGTGDPVPDGAADPVPDGTADPALAAGSGNRSAVAP
ncbi:S26 family signal peptidase [Halosimplex halobium]|uniref:S26 family signal peptidase n=1 Tax=Halosimplex halobium TaxID=3396618 RepID=UPI003F57815C